MRLKMSETEYQTRILCGNCGGENSLSVKIGIMVKDHLRIKSETCVNCHCRINTYTLQQKGL